MTRLETNSVLQTPVSRRTLVSTGTKLAYSAPLVVASMHFSELSVRAEEKVSGPDDTTNRGLFPPLIEVVSYTDPGWVLITGRGLLNATVEFATSGGNIQINSSEQLRASDAASTIELNTDDRIIVTVPEDLTIFTTTVETPDGIDIYDKEVKPEEKISDESQQADEEQSAPSEDEPANEVRAEEPPAEEEPSEEVPAEEPVVEQPPATEAPVEQPPVEEAPAEAPPIDEAPVKEAPAEEPPPEEPPVVETPAAEQAAEAPAGE